MSESSRYQPQATEAGWQRAWKANGLHSTPEIKAGDEAFYALSMFPESIKIQSKITYNI